MSQCRIDPLGTPPAIKGLTANPGISGELDLRTRLARDPGDSRTAGQLARILERSGRLSEAIEVLKRLLARVTDDGLRLDLAKLLVRSGDFGAALEELRRLRPPTNSSFEVETLKAGTLGMLGRHAQQIPIYRKLLKHHSDDPRLWERVGNAFKYSGRTDEAIRAFQRSVKIRTTYGEGWWALANLKTYRFPPHDVAAMSKALTGQLSPEDRAPLHFALGKALEDRGEFEESFDHYAAGNRIKTAGFSADQLDPGRVTEFVDRCIELFEPDLMERLRDSGDPSIGPIFVVGLQRSGSTLVEQILASHSRIEGLAEPDALLHSWIALEARARRSGKTIWQALREIDSGELRKVSGD